MHNHRTLVGLDVHARATIAAGLALESGELWFRRINAPPRSVVNYLEQLPGPVLATYEAGPTGYGLAREAAAQGIEVRVCAPGSIPRKPGERVKTDRRDAERLVRSLLAGELSFVRVPTVEEEQFRDLARCREAARADLMRARHRLSRLLLRREIEFPGPGAAWSNAYHQWLGPARSSPTIHRAACSMTTWRRSARSSSAALGWTPRSSSPRPPAPGRSRSRTCAACAGSTPSPPTGCAARSATSVASSIRAR